MRHTLSLLGLSLLLPFTVHAQESAPRAAALLSGEEIARITTAREIGQRVKADADALKPPEQLAAGDTLKLSALVNRGETGWWLRLNGHTPPLEWQIEIAEDGQSATITPNSAFGSYTLGIGQSVTLATEVAE